MRRFRNWSDPKRSAIPESLRSSTASHTSTHPSGPLPALPVGDFRTSLILPDLSRRFTVLRAASGDPVSLDDLKSKLANQRARGAENYLSEEETDMFLQTLGRIRSKPSVSSTSSDSTHSPARGSVRSTETTTSSATSTSGSTKRYSNNMFGSGKFRDHTYLRSVAKERAGKGGAGKRSGVNSSTSGRFYKASDTSIPEETHTDSEPSAHDSDTTPLASGVESSASELEQGIVKTFQRGHLRRASLALDEVIREFEEKVDGDGDGDGDDKILIPRSPAPERASSLKSISKVDKPRSVPSTETNVFETGTAVSPDPPTQDAALFRSTPSPYPRAETSPTPRLPGYIPGMPRPMTPRDANFDLDEVSPSSSSTPRATSPRIPITDRATSPTFASSSVLRRDSTRQHRAASPQLTNPGTPIATLLSGVNGRFTPDRSHSPDGPSVDFGNPVDSSLLGRRRPVSPYSQGTYQSMTVSSRPTTPSNVTWKAPASPGSGNASGQNRSGSVMGFSDIDFAVSGLPSQVRNGFDRPSMHTRNDSNMSSSDLHEVIAQLSRSGSLVGSRSLRSPALPDSPLFESVVQSTGAFTLSKRGQPPSLGSDIGSSPPGNAALRSSTPTQYPSRSSASPVFSDHDTSRSSRRGSHQAASSPFTLNQSQTLVLSPLANSSRSSLESAGSSYHTWEDKQDRTIPRVAALEPQPPAWHDLSNKAGELSSTADGNVEEIVQQYSGLNKGDFVAIQERLLFAAKLKAEVPEPRERRNSLRRRRPSASQSVTDATQQGSPPRAMSPQNVLKASALLDSVVDSIQAPRSKHSSALSELRTDTDAVVDSSTEPEPSSATRRKNALARALFGASDSDQSLTSLSPLPTDEANTGSDLLAERPPLVESSSSALSLHETLSPSSPSVNAGVITSSSSSTEQPDKQQELTKEVQRRTQAAMADLNRMPSNAKVHDASQRRRVERGQISGPKLVSASTSVDTIPVRSPSAASGQLSAVQNQSLNSNKFGTRFKKIRGSLRAKPTLPTSDGSTQYPAELSSGNGDRSLASTPDGPPPFSAAEPSRSKLAIASPAATVATTGPGLKGFVSRFLRPRSGETPDPERRKQWPSSSASLATTSSYFAHQQSERNPDMDVSQQVSQSAPPDNKSFRPDTPVSPDSPSPHKPPPSAPPVTSSVPDPSAARAVDEGALRQFIDAANNLGLDQDALTELLARSSSVGPRLTTQSSKHLSTTSVDRSGYGKSDPPLSGPAPLSAAGSSANRSLVQSPQRPSGEIIEKAPIRKPLARNATTSEDAKSTIVRRTLIFPSEARQSTPEPGMGLRKSSSTRRRRSTSAASMLSNRSLHDRVPTPPPPKSSTARRFSAEQSPPMPHIPSSLLAQTEAISAPQSAPAVPLEKSNSAYESLYEMYTGDVKPAISVTADVQPPDTPASVSNPSMPHNLEPGTAVEVLELANGETIWWVPIGTPIETQKLI
jgi:serine/arginine repetitive matrix protein 2